MLNLSCKQFKKTSNTGGTPALQGRLLAMLTIALVSIAGMASPSTASWIKLTKHDGIPVAGKRHRSAHAALVKRPGVELTTKQAVFASEFGQYLKSRGESAVITSSIAGTSAFDHPVQSARIGRDAKVPGTPARHGLAEQHMASGMGLSSRTACACVCSE